MCDWENQEILRRLGERMRSPHPRLRRARLMESVDDGDEGQWKVLPRNLALQFDPPAVILNYDLVKRDGGATSAKSRIRRMPVRHLAEDCDVELVALELSQRHYRHLENSSIPAEVLRRAVQRLVDHRTYDRRERGGSLESPTRPASGGGASTCTEDVEEADTPQGNGQRLLGSLVGASKMGWDSQSSDDEDEEVEENSEENSEEFTESDGSEE